jgi:uncharacterized membrane protein
LRLTQFDLTAFDAGIFDNVLWRLGNGYNDVSDLTGSHHFSDHMSLLMLLAVPVYALVPQLGLPLLIVAQAASVALVALATWLLADHVGLDTRVQRAALLVTTIGAGAYNAATIDIHEVGLAVGPLAMTAVLALRGSRTRTYWIWPALAAAARVDIAVSVVIIGMLLRKDRPAHGRIAAAIGGIASVLMTIWLFVNPWDGTSFAFHFAHLDIESASQLPGAVLSNPAAALEPLLDPTMWGTIALWLAGFMIFVPLYAAKWILPAIPTVIIPVFGSWPQADKSHLHYWHVLLPMLAVTMVLGLARSAPAVRERAVHLAAVSVMLTWVFMPIFKPSFGQDLTDERAAVAYIEARVEASVAVPPNLVPHVSHRASVFELPTPFACPTLPIASFLGPDHPPDLVAIPANVLERPATPAAAAVAEALVGHYERVAVFGNLEVWTQRGDVPPQAYEIVCGAEASANS